MIWDQMLISNHHHHHHPKMKNPKSNQIDKHDLNSLISMNKSKTYKFSKFYEHKPTHTNKQMNPYSFQEYSFTNSSSIESIVFQSANIFFFVSALLFVIIITKLWWYPSLITGSMFFFLVNGYQQPERSNKKKIVKQLEKQH